MDLNYPLLLSQIINVVVMVVAITPFLLLVLFAISSARRLQRIEDRLADLAEEVKGLAASQDPS